MGWPGEKQRHSMSARGIQSKPLEWKLGDKPTGLHSPKLLLNKIVKPGTYLLPGMSKFDDEMISSYINIGPKISDKNDVNNTYYTHESVIVSAQKSTLGDKYSIVITNATIHPTHDYSGSKPKVTGHHVSIHGGYNHLTMFKFKTLKESEKMLKHIAEGF